MIDRARLEAFVIPERVQEVDAGAHALYAVSVGYGQDPLDARQLSFATGVVPVPSVVLVLAHPGFWLGDPRSGVDPTRVVHADQRFEILDAIPLSGIVRSRTRLTGLIDKGLGKAAILRAETLLETGDGRRFARLDRSTMIRGGGGFGGDGDAAPPEAVDIDGDPVRTVVRATRPEQALLYRLNGDLNPLHSDPVVARAAGFARPILHGLCTMGVVGHALLEALDYEATRLRAVTTRFVAPVFPGETIRTVIWAGGGFRATVTERDVVVATGRMTVGD